MRWCLTGFPQQDSELTEVEVNEVFTLMHYIGGEVSTNDTLPRGVVLLVEFPLDLKGDVPLKDVGLDCLGGHLYCVVLHVVADIAVLDIGLALGHFEG